MAYGDREDGMVALVTGAAGGIGRAICDALGRIGMHVVVTDLDGGAAEVLAKELAGQGWATSSAPLDICDRSVVEALVGNIENEQGHLDVVVNLAGTMKNQVLVKVDDDVFRQTMATHVEGTLNTMRAALPGMRARGYGRIVNMSSVAARGSIGGTAYGAAKGAIEVMTRSAALEHALHGITVNCVASGPVAAGMFMTVPDDYRAELIAKMPMRRMAEPEDVGACVAFLASRSAAYVTGETLMVDGGLTLGI